jgi:DNA-binding MarR family transcriptional regulator
MSQCTTDHDTCATPYSELTANDILVLSHISRACDLHPDAHVLQTVRGVALSLRISERRARRTLARLEKNGLVERSKDAHHVSGAYRTKHRSPFHTFRITPSGAEVLSSFRRELRW